MTQSNHILIRNIYYMLAYAFSDLKKQDYQLVGGEDFENISDLMAEILTNSTSFLLKRGLYREYVTSHQSLSTLRGKLDVVRSARNLAIGQQLLECEVDNLSENNIFNQIIKTGLTLLVHDEDVAKPRKNAIKQIMPFFDTIDTLTPSAIHWTTIHYQRSNQLYELPIQICAYIINRSLIDPNKEKQKLMTFSEEHFFRLYERFILAYYRRHHPELQATAETIDWYFDEERSVGLEYLPKMITDITLHKGNKTLIIDAKFYSQILRAKYTDKLTYNSSNFYQISAYVSNMDVNHTGNVSGMLLYAQTDNETIPDSKYQMRGSSAAIYVRTLDLNQEFNKIRDQLEKIVLVLE